MSGILCCFSLLTDMFAYLLINRAGSVFKSKLKPLLFEKTATVPALLINLVVYLHSCCRSGCSSLVIRHIRILLSFDGMVELWLKIVQI